MYSQNYLLFFYKNCSHIKADFAKMNFLNSLHYYHKPHNDNICK